MSARGDQEPGMNRIKHPREGVHRWEEDLSKWRWLWDATAGARLARLGAGTVEVGQSVSRPGSGFSAQRA